MYSGCFSGRQNLLETIFLLLLRLWGCGQGAERLVHHIHRRPVTGRDSLSDISPLSDLLQRLYRSEDLSKAEPSPCRKFPAMLAATCAAEALTESRAKCA